MRSRRILSILFVIIFICTFLSGCKSFTPTSEIKIMFIPKSAHTSFWKITIAGFNTALAEYNAKGVVVAPLNEEDYIEQIRLIELAIEEKYNAIVISSIDFDKPVEALKKARSKGIEIVVIDSDVNMEEIEVKISTDNYQAGLKMAERMCVDLNYFGKVGLIMFDERTKNGLDRMNGFIDGVSKHKGMDIVVKQSTTSNVEDSKYNTIKMLNDYPSVNAVVAFNELTTVGVGIAIAEMNRKDIYAVGFDNNVPVVDFLENGIFDSLVIQNQYAMGYLSVEYAIKLIKNQVREKVRLDTGIHIITKENMFDPEIQNVLFPFEVETGE